MPVNLKPYYDSAIAADAEVQRILNDMDAAFNEGTDEGKTKALELRPARLVAQLGPVGIDGTRFPVLARGHGFTAVTNLHRLKQNRNKKRTKKRKNYIGY